MAESPANTAVQTVEFDPSATSELYDQFLVQWTMNQDFAEMLLSILRGGDYLDQFGSKSAEKGGEYRWRLLNSLAMDHCADLINLRVDNLFRTLPVRQYDDSPYRAQIEAFLADVDGGGTGMDEFMRRAMRMYYVNGVDVVVDKTRPADGETPLNAAQEQRMNLRPYLHAFSPLERLDWAVDHSGQYQWVRYDLGELAASDELSSWPDEHQYLTMTRDEWRLYRVQGPQETADGKEASPQVLLESGPNALGVAPVVSLYFRQSLRADCPKIPLSLLTRIAPIARYLLNLVSQIQIDIYRNIAFLVATGVDSEKIPTEISPMGCWALPEGSDLKDVAGEVGHIEQKVRFAQTLMEAILRIGKLTGATGDLKTRASSGVQVAVERTDLDNEMRMTAHQFEAAETEIVRMAVSRQIGKPIPADDLNYGVEYNTKFVLTPAGDLIRQAKEFVGVGVEGETPELLRILLRKILDAVANDDDQEYVDALAEIEKATFSLVAPEEGAAGEPNPALASADDMSLENAPEAA